MARPPSSQPANSAADDLVGGRPPSDSAGIVCPFCAHVRAESVGPCPKCTMEDTPTTRRSTGERIGPWFVLQRKNPTAPGLRFNVLLSLARKGHVTARSIVRGPTTGQLWRFASQVKGLSRVFGTCWHCQASVSPEAIGCPRCKSPQDVPGDPDAFIETAPLIPVMREVADADDAERPAELAELERAIRSAVNDADPPVTFPDDEPPARERPAAAPRTAGEAIMSAKDLAAVFQLDTRGGFSRRLGQRLAFTAKIVAAALVVVGGSVAALLYVRPEFRDPARRYVNAAATSVGLAAPFTVMPTPGNPAVANAGEVGPSGEPGRASGDGPATSEPPRLLTTSIPVAGTEPTTRSAQRPEAPAVIVPPTGTTPSPATGPARSVDPPAPRAAPSTPAVVAPVDPPGTAPSATPPGLSVDTTRPAEPAPRAPAGSWTGPTPSVPTTGPAIDPMPAAPVAPTATRPTSPPGLGTRGDLPATRPAEPLPTLAADADMDATVVYAFDLRRMAFDAEASQEWARAVLIWERIESLPADAQPTDTKPRLTKAREMLARQRRDAEPR